MSEPMKRSNTTDYDEVIYRVPKRYLVKAKKIMTSYRAEGEVISVPRRQVYPISKVLHGDYRVFL